MATTRKSIASELKAHEARKRAGSGTPKEPAKMSKEEKAADAKRIKENSQLMAVYSSVIVPTWFGQKDVSKTINKPLEIGPETALCLVYIGARGAHGCSQVGVEFNLRPSGFDREEAGLFAMMGCSSLLGGKYAKFAKKPVTEEDRRHTALLLTAKGQKLFDLIKRVALQVPPGKSTYMI